MIYLFISGNAGNQLFQYAFARNLMEKTKDKLTIDFRYILKGDGVHKAEDVLKHFHVKPYQMSLDGRYYPVQRFVYAALVRMLPRRTSKRCRIRYTVLNALSIWLEKLGVYFYDGSNYLLYCLSPPFTKNKFVRGFWESERYFMDIKEVLLEELTPRYKPLEHNISLYEQIEQTESVCVTVRRYELERTLSDDFCLCDADYFYRGVKYIQQKYPKAKVFVFSDDIQWCKENLDFGADTFYETGNDPIWEKLRLMYSCKHFVISNSTFSWWAQFLSRNENKIVVAPPEWRKGECVPIDIYGENWIYLDKTGNIIKHY